MRWKEACLQSDVLVAVMQTERCIYFRFLDGFSFCENKISGVRRAARKSEVDGFLNWQPF